MSQTNAPVPLSIPALLAAQAASRPNVAAIRAPGRKPLSYGSLWTQVQYAAAALGIAGIGPSDRVAIVMPNGPEMAVALLAVACTAISAPLNPGYHERDFEFYLPDLRARALLTPEMGYGVPMPAGVESPARTVAARLGIPIVELHVTVDAEAGRFTLRGQETRAPQSSGLAQPTNLALVLHTSGTTSKPKAVPLTHANLCASAHRIRNTLRLTPHDQCLNVLPLFHIHGLVAALLSSLAGGGSICCLPGFDAALFFASLQESRPTWYTAVPTIHHAIVQHAPAHHEIASRANLRFVRSSSASLPQRTMAELESVFSAPVIEAYGMTEAAHQIASNPLPPAERKPRSVGPAAGPELAVMDEMGNLLPTGRTGEIVVRGANVMAGYLDNPEANAGAFAEGWFRTGDQGHLDDDGYLFLTGRIKEMINRGGEKVNPVEVDDWLSQHPAVDQSATFPVAHPTLGQDIIAAVVPRSDASVTSRELRTYLLDGLAAFKVPSRVLIVPQIPKSPTGKVQRLALASHLAELVRPQHVLPRTVVEKALASIWSEVLGLEAIGAQDNFFTLGGDSLHAMRLVARVQAHLGVALPLSTVFREPELTDQASAVEDLLSRDLALRSSDPDSAAVPSRATRTRQQ